MQFKSIAVTPSLDGDNPFFRAASGGRPNTLCARRAIRAFPRYLWLSPLQSRMNKANTVATRIMLSIDTDSSMP
jgi:hypothetical protein